MGGKNLFAFGRRSKEGKKGMGADTLRPADNHGSSESEYRFPFSNGIFPLLLVLVIGRWPSSIHAMAAMVMRLSLYNPSGPRLSPSC